MTVPTWVCATCGPVPAGTIRHLDHNSPHGHETHECGSSAGLDWTKKEHDVTETAREYVRRYFGHDPERIDRLWAELEAADDGIEPCQMPLWPGWCGLPLDHDGNCATRTQEETR